MEKYLTVDPREVTTAKMVSILQGAVAPRPIAFASTVDRNGKINLSPFSFFNLFSTQPPILIFSPSRRVRNNTTKHTLENVKEVPEVVINIVNYSMVEQSSLASCEYPPEVNEFIKAGFNPFPSVKVKPPRVAESPASFECRVKEIISLGTEGGAGNLIICEVILAHVKNDILNEQGGIDPQKLDAVARMGADYYCRAQGENIFEVPKPNTKLGIGFDRLPEEILNSKVFSKNELARLANIEKLPIGNFSADKIKHLQATELLKQGRLQEAWQLLLE